MKRFLTGFASIGVAMFVVALIAPRPWWFIPTVWQDEVSLVFVLVLMPVTIAWTVAEIYNVRRPRRLFRGRRRATAILLVAGALAALLSFAVGGLGLVAVDRWVADWIIMGVATMLTALGAVALLPRLKPGRCIYCSYDLRATSGGLPRCPECGTAEPTP